MSGVKYPNIKVELFGVVDGNAFAILGEVTMAMNNAGLSDEKIKEFRKEATSGDYNHLIQTCCGWVTCS